MNPIVVLNLIIDLRIIYLIINRNSIQMNSNAD